MSFSAPTLQDIAKEKYQVSGTVWHVTFNGSDANDGLSELTGFATPSKATNVATAGDLILLGPGILNNGSNTFCIPDKVNVKGFGIDATTVWSSADETTQGAICKPGSYSVIEDFTVYGWGASNVSGYCAPFGCVAPTQSMPTNFVIRRCKADGDFGADGFLFQYKSTASPGTVRGVIENCVSLAQFDAYNAFDNSNRVSDFEVLIRRSDFRSDCPLLSWAQTRGMVFSIGKHIVEDTNVFVKSVDPGQVFTYGIHVKNNQLTNTISVVLNNVGISGIYSTAGLAADLLIGTTPSSVPGGASVFVNNTAYTRSAGAPPILGLPENFSPKT